MKSMTGYGHSFFRSDDYLIECVIKSYNNRYLDIIHSLSPQLSSFEGYIDGCIKKEAERGRIEISMKLRVLRSQTELAVDEGLLTAYRDAYRRIAGICDAPEPLVSDYASVEGIITEVRSDDGGIYREGVEKALSEALEAFAAEKAREGEGTRKDLERLGDRFAASLEAINERSGELEAHYRTLLEAKYEELTGEKAGSSSFISELGAILVRYSINEEVSRLRVHIEQYRKLLDSTEPVGKKLDFLCQEMQRECNTIASKSQLVEINLLVVSMKDDVENIREQIRNIE